MTTAQNNVDALDRNQTRVQLPVTTNLTVNEGDLVYWDTSNKTVTPVTNKSQVTGATATFLGMALQSNAQNIYPGDPDQVGVLVLVRGVVLMLTTAEDTYEWFTPVTGTSDPQTVTSTGVTTTVGSSFNVIGYTLPPVASAPRVQQTTPVGEFVTGAAGVRVQVILSPSYLPAAAI